MRPRSSCARVKPNRNLCGNDVSLLFHEHSSDLHECILTACCVIMPYCIVNRIVDEWFQLKQSVKTAIN